MAARRFGAADRLVFTGVTGTNGKTTTTYLLEAILEAAGRRPAVIGTVTYRFGEQSDPGPLTTPGALALHEALAEMQAAGATDVVMEATSIALEQGRVAGCRFRVAGSPTSPRTTSTTTAPWSATSTPRPSCSASC